MSPNQNELFPVSFEENTNLPVIWRKQMGEELWQNTVAKLWGGVLVVVGFICIGLLGSLGSSAALKGTAIQGIYATFNINRFMPWELAA